MAGDVAAAQTVPPPLGKLIDAGGYRVHLYCTGATNPTVVVVGGGFSFDWGLIQPEVAKFARICTYDPSGTAWSDPFPEAQQGRGAVPRCIDRVTEIHRVLENADIRGPYVLVGFSIGGLIARLYAHDFPQEVAGMVIVDHAFIDAGPDTARTSEAPAGSLAGSVDSPPVLIYKTPIALGIEDDRNFGKLPELDRNLHTWAMSISPLRPSVEMAAECFATVDDATRSRAHPLGDRPLIVVRTNNDAIGYEGLQMKLLTLSRDSKQMLAAHSSHMVIIDEPEVVTNGIREVVEAVKNGTKLPR